MASKKAPQPILSIKNFQGMGDQGLYWIDGFISKMLQGQSILTQGWGVSSFINSTQSGWSALSDLPVSMDGYPAVSINHVAAIGSNGSIFDFDIYGFTATGLIHTIPSSGSQSPCQGAGVLSTRKGNLLYSSANHLGVGWVGTATSGTTTKLVDTTRNFTSLGLGSGTGVNKIYNYTKGVEHTITSVSTTTNTNDTLNFAAGTAPSANDVYVVFCDTRFSFGTASAAAQFAGQPDPTYWNRQILLWNNAYWALNGNYLSKLASDETTWTSDILDEFNKQLPTNCNALMAEVNTDRILVSAYRQGKGRLLLWDGYAEGWINELKTDSLVTGLCAYSNGWIVLIAGTLYFTDGYTLQSLGLIPDALFNTSITPRKNTMVIAEDNVLIGFTAAVASSRLTSGVYRFNITDQTWSFFPITNKSSKPGQIAPALFSLTLQASSALNSATPQIMCSFSDSFMSPTTYEIAVVNTKIASRSSAVLFINLPRKLNINLIELNLAPRNDYSLVFNKDNTVRVNYGQGHFPMHQFFSPSSGSTTTVLKNPYGALMRSKIGQELFVSAGSAGYQRTFITSIANAGLSTEELTVSPALTAVPTTSTVVKKFDLYSAGSAVLNSETLDSAIELDFNVPNFYSDKLWIEIVLEGQDVFPLDLHEINIW